MRMIMGQAKSQRKLIVDCLRVEFLYDVTSVRKFHVEVTKLPYDIFEKIYSKRNRHQKANRTSPLEVIVPLPFPVFYLKTYTPKSIFDISSKRKPLSNQRSAIRDKLSKVKRSLNFDGDCDMLHAK